MITKRKSKLLEAMEAFERTPEGQALLARAKKMRALGLDGPIENHRWFCGGCREWCDGIYYRTLDGTPLCRACAEKAGHG